MTSPEALPPAPSLGARVELFTPSRVNVYVGYVFGTLLLLGGLALVGAGLSQISGIRNPPNPKAHEDAIGRLVGGLLVGGLLVFLGGAGIAVARSLAVAGVEVCENGLRSWPPGPNSYNVLWSEIACIEERHVRDEVSVELGGPLLSRTYRRFVIIRHDRERFTFDRDMMTGIGRFGKRLRAAAEVYGIEWVAGPPA